MFKTTIYLVTGAVAGTAMPAAAAVQTLISTVGAVDASGRATVELSFLNTSDAILRFEPPARLAAELSIAGHHAAVTLERGSDANPGTLAAGSFAHAAYTVALPGGGGAGTLSLPSGAAFALALPKAEATQQLAAAGVTGPGAATATMLSAAPVVVQQSLNSAAADTGNAFLGNLSSYLPIYAAYGPGTSTDAKIQISFKYQLFGTAGATGADRSWIDGITFAYSQRLYWDLGAKSSPFRNVDYNPELIYIVPAPVRVSGVAFGGRGGIAHESNGRDGTASRSSNYLYIQPMATLPVGTYKLSLGPRLWTYVGDLSDNPDLVHYRGNTGLFAEIGQDNGLRISTNTRLNFGSGKGAFEAEVSYPLNRWIKPLNLYVFAQGFTGYGENLLDYNRHANRLRIGVGFVR